MPSPEVKTVYPKHPCKCEVPADSCRIRFGHKDRDSIAMKWERDHFYLSDCRDHRQIGRIIAVEVPLTILAEHWPDFIRLLQRKVAEAAAESEVNDG